MIDEHREGYVMAVTTTEPERGRALAGGLVHEGLAACVQVIPKVESFYTWEGEVQSDAEVVLLCKTHREKLPEIERYFSDHHTYDVPELIALPITAGLDDYMTWMRDILAR